MGWRGEESFLKGSVEPDYVTPFFAMLVVLASPHSLRGYLSTEHHDPTGGERQAWVMGRTEAQGPNCLEANPGSVIYSLCDFGGSI